MELIGQKENVKLILKLINKFLKDNSQVFNLFFYKCNNINPNHLTKWTISKLGLEWIFLDCISIRSLSLFCNKLSTITFKSVIYLKNYDKLRKNIRIFFENFLLIDHKNKNVQKIINSIIIITTNTKKIRTNLKYVSINMSPYSLQELEKIIYKIMEKNFINYDEIKNLYLFELDSYRLKNPRDIQKYLILKKRKNKILEILNLNFDLKSNRTLIIFCVKNNITIYDLYYLFKIYIRDEAFLFQKTLNNYCKPIIKCYFNLFISYLSKNFYINFDKKTIYLTKKGSKLIKNAQNKSRIMDKIKEIDLFF